MLTQGKRAAWILHEIINFCDDADIVLKVYEQFYSHAIENLSFRFIRFIFMDIDIQLAHMSQQIQHRHPIISCLFFAFEWKLLFNVCNILIKSILNA